MFPEKNPASPAATSGGEPGDEGRGGVVEVALPVPLDRSFDYLAPEPLPAVGCRVLVPFGPRPVVGIVTAHAARSGRDGSALKAIGAVLDPAPLLAGELLASLRWAARYYQHPLGEVLHAALPVALRSPRALPAPARAALALTAAGQHALYDPARRRGTRIDRLLAALESGPIGTAGGDWGASAVRTALARGWVERVEDPPCRSLPASHGPEPNDAQQAAAEAVIGSLGRFAPFLLDGVTGSGKTEVYLRIIDACLAAGRQALVLVPEIALTPQTLRRFRARLGVEVAMLHSGLGDVERARTWLDAARGRAMVLLGTRSAILTPLARPGAIIVDEEHDASYKQQDGWRYHARDLAVVRARALSVPVVLGSATPSLESLANIAEGRYRHLRLPQRAGDARPPTVEVIDLRRQRVEHGFSVPALDAIGACLERGEQVLVFRNRRGYAPVLLCRDCGWRGQCAACERPFTLHRREGRLRCHHCGREQRAPRACPGCGSLALAPLGTGTERIEETLAARFPGVPLLRVDRDTTRGRRQRDALFESLPEDGARILVGTQMLAKGHDLPRLTLVVVVGADEGLYSVDFRALERFGQLVVQVAGRAGRADRAGTVILQTHDPAHPQLRLLLERGYAAFAARLLEERRATGLPPCTRLALLRAEARRKEDLDAFLTAAAAHGGRPGVELHGPLDAPMPLRAGVFRGQVLAESAHHASLQAFLPGWLAHLRALRGQRRVRWSVDVDPAEMY
ncbi:MAG: primosomal protein N' [Xanthomonadales bacterium]|nr:primosomal protein N' [Xanthomonadales bacterium]